MTVERNHVDGEITVDLDVRRSDLLAFAAELAGDPVTAEALVSRAIRHWRSVPEGHRADSDTGYAELRAWVTRGYLSEGMVLGRPPAADVDEPVPAPPGEAGTGDALDRALRESSKLRRATLLLRYRAGLGDVELARTVGSTPDGIAEYLDYVLADLGVGPGGYREDDVRDRLTRHGGAVAQDLARVTDPPDGLGRDGGFAWVDIVDPGHTADVPAGPDAPTATPDRGGPGAPEPEDPLLAVLTDSLESSAARPHPRPTPKDERGSGSSRRRWVWLGVALLVVATFVVVIALVLGTRSGRAGGEEAERTALSVPTAAGPPPVPSPITGQLPGTRVLADYSGQGSRTLRAAGAVPRAGFELALGLACRGAGPVQAAGIRLADCAAPAVAPLDELGPLDVRAPAGTRWRAVLVEQPVVDTSGSLRSPPDPSLADPSRPGVVAAAHGMGSGTVRLAAVPGTGRHLLRVSLLCSGAGVALRGADHVADGAYARNCIEGWSYEFDLGAARLPAVLSVIAAPATGWRLSVTLR